MKTQLKAFSSARAVLAVLVLGAACIVAGCDNNAKITVDPYPKRSDVRVVIKPGEKQEDIRLTSYWPDGKTPMGMRIERKNGETVYETFGHNGLPREVKEYFPLPDAAKKAADPEKRLSASTQPYEFVTAGRQLKSHILFSADGSVVTNTERYRQDGTRELIGKRLADGSFQNLVFHKDGQALNVSQLFAATGELLSAQEFADGGVRLLSVSARLADGRLEKKSFNEVGSLVSLSVEKSDGEQAIDFFKADGKRYMTVFNRFANVEAVYYNAEGQPTSARRFDKDGSMQVVEYLPGSGEMGPYGEQVKKYTELSKQQWSFVAAKDSTDKPRLVLTKVEVFDKNGKGVRQFHFNAQTGVLEKIWMYENGVNTHDRQYNPDGTLESVPWVAGGSPVEAAAKNTDPARKKGAKVESDDLKMIKRYSTDAPYEDPRPLVTPVTKAPVQNMRFRGR